jgi:aldose 1-epimerase
MMNRRVFGVLADGRAVEAVTLSNASGVSACIIAYGATLQSLLAPDSSGAPADIALGYADLASYVSKPEYLGATIGRVANRIARGRFNLDGRTYATPQNEGEHTLHGGKQGFDKVLWDVVDVTAEAVTLRYVSPDGEEGFPGTLTVQARYSLNEQSELLIEYRATTDRPTVVNMTNHAVWNLAGEGSAGGAMGQWLMIAADRYTPVDATLIPTGELRAVTGTVFDFRTAKPIVQDLRDAREPQIAFGRGFDHNWVLGDAPAAQLRFVARAEDRVSGRVLEVLSDQPGVQFYSGNFLNGTRVGKSGRLYRQGDGFALEAQAFPDTVNQPAFGSARLAPGEEYRNRIVYRFSARKFAVR